MPGHGPVLVCAPRSPWRRVFGFALVCLAVERSAGRGRTRAPARSRMALIVLAAGLLAAPLMVPPAAMSEDVRRRLAAGDVVVTHELPPGASNTALGGTAVAIMRAAPEQVWRVIVDYRGHPRYYPRVTAAEVVESDERHVVVRYQVTVHPFSFGFYMDKFPVPAGAGSNGISPTGVRMVSSARTRATGRSTRRRASTRVLSLTPLPCAPCCRPSSPAQPSAPASRRR